MNHKWVDIVMTEGQKVKYLKISKCSNGDCNCERKIDRRYRMASYYIGKKVYEDTPECNPNIK